MATVELDHNPGFNRKIARLPGVRSSVRAHAQRIASKAEARLSHHHQTGAAHIEIDSGTVDSTVSLVDDAALSIEFGHYNIWSDLETRTAGLYIITGAAGLR